MTPLDEAAILVTGGCGFIGANLVRSLLGDGYEVRVLDDLSAAGDEYVRGLDIDLTVGDVADPQVAAAAVRGCECVVHLAAETSVRKSVRDPGPSFRTNVAGTLALLRASAADGVRRFIFASSNAALGEHEPPLDEWKVPRPVSPYGASKLASEAYCSAFRGAFGLETVTLRFANAYGPYSTHKTSVIAKFLAQLQAAEPLTIYGDGSQTRDFVFVADVVGAIRAALEANVAGETFHIASGSETSVVELARLIGEATQRTPTLRWCPETPGEIHRNYATVERARELLGWRPTVALREGLAVTYQWLDSTATTTAWVGYG